jgi:hypothetical protein
MTETEQFTPNAPMPPSRVLPSQSDHQIPQFVRHWRTPDRARVSPVLGDQPAVPGQQRPRCVDDHVGDVSRPGPVADVVADAFHRSAGRIKGPQGRR